MLDECLMKYPCVIFYLFDDVTILVYFVTGCHGEAGCYSRRWAGFEAGTCAVQLDVRLEHECAQLDVLNLETQWHRRSRRCLEIASRKRANTQAIGSNL